MNPSGELSANSFGDRDDLALAALVEQHHSFVFRICLKFLRHQHDAEDATQETFSRFVKYVDRWDRRRPIRPWLATIAGNRCRTLLAKQRSTQLIAHQSLSDVQEPVQNGHAEVDASKQLHEEVAVALSKLPAMQKVAFEMFHQRGLSYQQISSELDCPLGTVKTWVHRARQQLIDRLREREAITTAPKPIKRKSR